GVGEQDDLRAALDFVAKQFPAVPVLLAGFSFGSWVGLRVGSEDGRVSHLVGLGVPVNSSDFSFLRSSTKPKLFVQGSADQFGAVEKVTRLAASLPGENHLVVVQGADHFFSGKLDQLDAAITTWLKTLVSNQVVMAASSWSSLPEKKWSAPCTTTRRVSPGNDAARRVTCSTAPNWSRLTMTKR